MDPLTRFRRNISEKVVRRLPEELMRGQLYVVTRVERRSSEFKSKGGEEIYSMIAHFRDKGTNFYVYMGADFNNPTVEEVAAFNSLIAARRNPSIAFYGYQGRAKVMDLLKYGEGIDEIRFATCTSSEVV